jgi:hypothetical protein
MDITERRRRAIVGGEQLMKLQMAALPEQWVVPNVAGAVLNDAIRYLNTTNKYFGVAVP